MIVTAPHSRCPAAGSWLRLLDENVSIVERDELESHLESCDPCRDTYVSLAGEGSLQVGPAVADDAPIGQTTLEILTRMIHRRQGEGGDPLSNHDTVVVPAIPGFADLEVIGRGGMGIVFRARQIALDRPVAIKVLTAAGSLDRTAHARAVREALTLARLRHPNILSIHGSGNVEGVPYLVTEWVDGGTLQQRLDAATFSPREAASMVLTLAGAVGVAHAMGIIHRDLKPANVLLSTVEGSAAVPKLADFGLARCRGEDRDLTETGMILGTPNYMAPEQTGLARSCGEVGPLTDIHALGAILQALLTGQPPYAADSPWAILIRVARGEPDPIRRSRSDVPRDLETIVAKCLSRDPARRYRSADGLADDLGRFLDGRPVSARPISMPLRMAKWARRRPTLATAGLLIVLLVFGAIAGTVYHVAELRRSYDKIQAEKAKAEDALKVANRARVKSRRALGTLTDGAVKRMVERGSVLNEADLAFLRKLRDYYEEPEEDGAGEPTDSLKSRGVGLSKLASFFQGIGRTDDAVSTLKAAMEVNEEIVRRCPDELEAGLRRVDALMTLGTMLTDKSRNREALHWSKRATAACRQISGQSREKRLQLCRTICTEGIFSAAVKEWAEAERALTDAEKVLDDLKSETADDKQLYPLAHHIFYNQGLNLRNLGRLDDSERCFGKTMANARLAQGRFPADIRYRDWELTAWDRLISSQIERKRYAEALILQQRMVAALREFADRSPEPQKLIRYQIASYSAAREILAELGRGEEAEVQAREAVAAGVALIGLNPSDFPSYSTHSDSMIKLSSICEKTGRAIEAVELQDRMVDLLAPWMKSAVHHDQINQMLTAHFDTSARLHAQLGNHALAARRLDQLLQVCPEADRPGRQLDLARARRSAAEQAAKTSGMAEQTSDRP